jgi:hypothetical protein
LDYFESELIYGALIFILLFSVSLIFTFQLHKGEEKVYCRIINLSDVKLPSFSGSMIAYSVSVSCDLGIKEYRVTNKDLFLQLKIGQSGTLYCRGNRAVRFVREI